ncbi:MAG: dUTP diphosphatase [Pseudomonadales bacterium]
MSSRQQQFEAMLALQHRMNSKVHPEWFKQGFAYYRALWIECAELMEHHGYKWWKKQTPDLEQVCLEIVDIWHFGLSMLIDGRDFSDIAAEMEHALHDYEHSDTTILTATETLAQSTLSSRRFSVPDFWSLLQSADMSSDDLYRMYVGKNVLNFFRQDNGYKEGSYLKLWSGREDNEHLVEISDALDSRSADYEKHLYAALKSRYQQVLEEVER